MRINKVPFFLWLTQRRDDLTLDLKNHKVSSKELGESSIKEVPIYWVILMKYFPLGILAYFFFIPRNLFEVGLLGIAFALLVIVFLLLKQPFFLQLFLLLSSIISLYLIFTLDWFASPLSTVLTLFVELLMLGIVLYDIVVLKGYKNWYYLEAFKNEIDITFIKKSEKKIFFIKRKAGATVKKRVYIKGYFLKVDNEK